MIYKMTLKDSADEMTFDLLEVPIVDKDIEGAVDNVTLDGNQYTDYLYLKKQFIQKWSILCDTEYTQLRGFYTRQFENADVPSYRLYYGDDIIRNSTLGGEHIQFNVEGVADGTISLAQIDGNTTQDGTPTPSTPVPIETVTGRQTVTVTGKNLFDKDNVNEVRGYIAGTTLTSGTDYTIYIPCEENTTYTIQKMVAVPQTANRFRVNSYAVVPTGGATSISSSYFWNAGDGSATTTHTYTTPTGANYLGITVMTANTSGTTTADEMYASIQIEKGSTATTYEPYNGQDYEINLTQNLFDESQDTESYYLNSSGAEISDTQWDVSGYIPVVAGQTYSYEGIATAGNAPYSAFYDATKTYVSSFKQATGTNTLQIPNGVAYVRFSIYHARPYGGNDNTTFKLWDTPNKIELCKIGDYQDRIYKENGTWYIEKQTGKVVLDGSESYSLLATLTTVSRFTANNVVQAVPSSQCCSDHFTWYSNQATNEQFNAVDNEAIHMRGDGVGIGIKINTSTASTANALKTWLASNPTTVYYPLATPTTTEITDEEVLEGLEALQDEAISVGQHSIYTDTPNALPTLTFDLTEYLSKSTTIIPETAVRLTLTDGGVINACGCRKDVQLTMRETIE